MAGQPRSRGTRALARTPRASSSWAAVAGASVVASGSASATVAGRSASGPEPRTRATYRMLILRGLLPTEAANLTACICGLPVGDSRWTIDQLNRLLFLRQLNRTGRVGGRGEPDRDS